MYSSTLPGNTVPATYSTWSAFTADGSLGALLLQSHFNAGQAEPCAGAGVGHYI